MKSKPLENFQRFDRFMDEYHASKLFLRSIKKTINQPPFLDTDIKQKTFYKKGISYAFPMIKISLKITPDYIREVREIPGFEAIESEIEKLKQKAREERVEINTTDSGGVEFYKKVYPAELLKKINSDSLDKLYELTTTKKDYQKHAKSNKLHPEVRKFLESQLVKKLFTIQKILNPAFKPKENKNAQKPQLRIVK